MYFRPPADRNFLVRSVVFAAAYAVLYAQTVTLPNMLQTLFGYDATHSGDGLVSRAVLTGAAAGFAHIHV